MKKKNDAKGPAIKEKQIVFDSINEDDKIDIAVLKMAYSQYSTTDTERKDKKRDSLRDRLLSYFDRMIQEIKQPDRMAQFLTLSERWNNLSVKDQLKYFQQLQGLERKQESATIAEHFIIRRKNIQSQREPLPPRPPQPIKPLAEKIQWQRDRDPDTEKLKAHIEGLKKAEFITFTDINTVMSGEEIPRTVKRKTGVEKSESRNMVYIFSIWHNQGLIKNFVSGDKIENYDIIINSFKQRTGKLFNNNSLSKSKKVEVKNRIIDFKEKDLHATLSEILK